METVQKELEELLGVLLAACAEGLVQPPSYILRSCEKPEGTDVVVHIP